MGSRGIFSLKRLRRDLEYRAPSGNPASARSTVEIAGGIEDEAIVGVDSIGSTAEVMEHNLGPTSPRVGRQLEYRPAAE